MQIKKCFCRHDYKVWANIYGDLTADFKGARTVMLCTKCNKRKYIKDYIEAPVNYNHFIDYCAIKKSESDVADDYLENVFKDKKKYIEMFCKKCKGEN